MSLGSFAVVAARERELGVPVTFENMAGFGWERPLLGVSMWTFMLGFAGFPLTGGFVGKFYVFAAAYEHGWTWLVIVGVLATLVSLYYYLGLVRAMFMRRTGGSPARADRRLAAARRAAPDGGRRVPRRHGRLVLRGPAADRPRAEGTPHESLAVSGRFGSRHAFQQRSLACVSQRHARPSAAATSSSGRSGA